MINLKITYLIKYRSIHTIVFTPDDRLVQTQIRTFDMDKVLSFGLTTYLDVKKDEVRDEIQKDLREKFQIYKFLRQIDKMFIDSDNFANQVKDELLKSKKIYVYTTKGDIMELSL